MLQIDEQEYDLKFSMKRIEMIEKATNKPVMASLLQNQGALGVGELKLYVAFSLIGTEEGAGHLSMQHGNKLAEQLLIEKGYAFVTSKVMEAIQRDCPFLFQAD